MTITSLGFLLLITVGGLCYYLLPKAWQWVWLLVLSLVFYCLAATPYTLVFLLLSTVAAWAATNLPLTKEGGEPGKASRAGAVTAIAILVNLGLWFLLKGNGLWLSVVNRLGFVLPFAGEAGPLPIAAALGMGYYTLQAIGYILDCRWGTAKPQRNIAKLFLFLLFFPQLITGPISRYNDLESLYEGHSFSYDRVARGAQRILWGFFKKLVLAQRLAVIVDRVWLSIDMHQGYYRLLVFLLYPIQMYADFSGCMDIVIGTAEVFGIDLKENFRNPFFARTVQEFWQRWHITLGTWAKDYVLYPLLKSRRMVSLGRKTKKRFGKRLGKCIPTAVGMFVLWMTMGVWHGGYRYVVGVSLWYWTVLMLGEICAPFLETASKRLGIRRDCFSWHLFQCVRTYLIYAVGAVFFRAPRLSDGVAFLKSLFAMPWQENANIWIFFDGTLGNLADSFVEINIIIIAVALLIVVAVLRERHGYARDWMARQGIVFRWMVWLGLFLFVLIYGKYGPGYDAAEFIYQGF